MRKIEEFRKEAAAKKEEEALKNPYNLANVFGRETAIATVADVTNIQVAENADELGEIYQKRVMQYFDKNVPAGTTQAVFGK